MRSSRDIRVALVDSRAATACVQRWHYSRRPVQNSQVHMGAMLDGRLLGVMSFGPPLDRRKVQTLVSGTAWDGMLELNRMAFSPELPRNSESRCLAVAARILADKYPSLEWLLSFADGVQCGDGTIYRAAGWLLTAVKQSDQIYESRCGRRFARMAITEAGSARRAEALALVGCTDPAVINSASARPLLDGGFRIVPGFMLRYVKPLRGGVVERLTVPVLPYASIDAAGARMYRGRRPGSIDTDARGVQPREGADLGALTSDEARHGAAD